MSLSFSAFVTFFISRPVYMNIAHFLLMPYFLIGWVFVHGFC
jgi:hypothetical protein